MPARSYLDYAVIDSDNQSGAPPLRYPEGWAGSAVNGSMAALASAVRNLGDNAAKLPLNDDASINTGDNGGRVGTLAFQNANAVTITGGETFRQSRKVIGKDIRFFFGTQSEAEDEEAFGWAICDGRTVSGVTTPDLRGRFPLFYDPTQGISSQDTGGTLESTTGESGAHGHTGAVLGHALTADEVPDLDVQTGTVGGSGNTRVSSVAYTGTGDTHTHGLGIDEGGAHTHALVADYQPYAAFIPLMYVGVS